MFMKKEDIRPGMVVEFRNGTRAFAVKVEKGSDCREEIIFINFTGYMGINAYDENLLIKSKHPDVSKTTNDWDIMKIYNTRQKYGLGMNGLYSDEEIKKFELLWLREEIVEISLAEISQKFNVPISQIRIKE